MYIFVGLSTQSVCLYFCTFHFLASLLSHCSFTRKTKGADVSAKEGCFKMPLTADNEAWAHETLFFSSKTDTISIAR